MTTFRLSPTNAARLVAPGTTVLVETDAAHPHRTAAAVATAGAIAAASGARLVLYDASAESRFTDPYPAGTWTADVDGPQGPRPLEPRELVLLGRDALRRLVVRAATSGVPTVAWVPRGIGAAALADAARSTGAQLVVRAAPPPDSLWRRISGRARPDYRRAVAAPIAELAPDGGLFVERLTCRLDAPDGRAVGPRIPVARFP